MDSFLINGGRPLEGEVRISGAKNAVLPAIAASLLTDGTNVITNVPPLRDVVTMCELLRILGADIEYDNETLRIDCSRVSSYEAPYDLVKTMRASVYVLGPLAARFGKARVSLPGGCSWGPRPIDLHLSGLEQLGARLDLDEGYINLTVDKLKGANITFKKTSVGATGNILMAAVLAENETVIRNAATEPEITYLVECLNSMGARIEGGGTTTLKISGVPSLKPLTSEVIPDRIEAGTFLCAAAIAGGRITLTGVDPSHLTIVLEKFDLAGLDVDVGTTITLESDGTILPVDVQTDVYPGFPTDMQAQWTALMSIADGNSVVEETIFYDRFTHVQELIRLGAHISVGMNEATILGVKELKGAPVMSTDLRASACLILAGLRATGTTKVHRVYHIDRGYDSIEKKLHALGADIQRVKDQ